MLSGDNTGNGARWYGGRVPWENRYNFQWLQMVV